MKFTRYIWELYRNSIEGQKDIGIFQNIDIASLSERFGFSIEMKYRDANQNLQSFEPYYEAIQALKTENINSIEQAKQFFEKQLIEPLLKDLGFREKDWIRQLPLIMGRQTKYYPDYAIMANATRSREKARIVLEAKYSINSEKDLQEAFDQARSYGLRLQSEKIVLADRDFVWAYDKTSGDFDSDPVLKLHWNELTDSDNLYELRKALNLK